MTSVEQVCRACLKEASENEEFLDVNTVNFPHRVTLRTKLKSCVPEVVSKRTAFAFVVFISTTNDLKTFKSKFVTVVF